MTRYHIAYVRLGNEVRWSVYDPDTVDEVGNLGTFASLGDAEEFVLSLPEDAA